MKPIATSVLENADRPLGRLGAALAISLGLNLLLWGAVGAAILRQKATPPQTIEFTRIVISKSGVRKTKVVSHQQVARRVAKIQHRIERTHPHRERPLRQPKVRQPVRQEAPPALDNKPVKPAPPANGAHNHTLISLDPAAKSEHYAKAGGNAPMGKPITGQKYGNKTQNPASPNQPAPAAAPTEEPALPDQPGPPPVVEPTPVPTLVPTPVPTSTPVPTPKPTPKPTPTTTPPPTPTPKPDPTPTPKPEPTNTPRPKGPTREAKATRTVNPSIPDELKTGEFHTYVRVKVEIGADGSATPSLRESSGNADIDARALAALRKWRWKPALKDGEPVASTQNFRFNFEVN